MKNYKIILLLFIASLFLLSGFKQKKLNGIAEDKWSGTVSFYEKITGPEGLISEWHMDATITNDTGTVVHSSDVSNNHGSAHCRSEGKTELDVGIDEEKGIFAIAVPVQGCYGTGTFDGITSDYAPTDETGIMINDQPLGSNHNVLSGTLRWTDGPDANGSTNTTIYTWNLTRGAVVAELIVTPSDYDNWKPEPGPDESTKGSVMNISLKVQDRNGGSPPSKAKTFELRLSNTSKEPGITLNAPLNPSRPLPDLRFLAQEDAQISQEGQFISFPSEDGINGEATIGSFDGGGWTTLTAIAILENGTRIQGSLLFPGGRQEILIPKRKVGSKIATSWLGANGDPGETDDQERTKGNTNDGDGLTAYEEYRGVISEGQFRRLDPNKKELGVKIKRAEIPQFSEGIAKFENATGLKVRLFFENEIGVDRKLNKNALSAHVYDQYALFLQIGTLVSDLGKSFGSPAIPKLVSKTVIDQNKIRQAYQDRLAEANSINKPLGYSEKDLFSTVTAHELSHSVNVPHHGSLAPNSLNVTITAAKTRVRIFDYDVREILTRPYTITGRGGDTGNEQSGDVNCFMLNNALCDWVVKTTPDSMFFYQVPLIPLGTKLCNNKDGTGLNTKNANGDNNYFGDAAKGNCLSWIKLK